MLPHTRRHALPPQKSAGAHERARCATAPLYARRECAQYAPAKYSGFTTPYARRHVVVRRSAIYTKRRVMLIWRRGARVARASPSDRARYRRAYADAPRAKDCAEYAAKKMICAYYSVRLYALSLLYDAKRRRRAAYAPFECARLHCQLLLPATLPSSIRRYISPDAATPLSPRRHATAYFTLPLFRFFTIATPAA